MLNHKKTNLGFIMLAIFISTFMTSVETTIITTALPTIISKLNGLAVQSWIFAMYLLTTALSTPIYGKMSDRLGRKAVYVAGLILFTVGSLLCGMATNIYILILFRAIQGLGAGSIMPITFTIIADLFEYEKRSNMIALNNTAWGISALLGPILGGFIVDKLNWHWVFFINVPLGIFVFFIIVFTYSEEVKDVTNLPIDFKGIFSLSVFLFLVLLLFQGLGAVNIVLWRVLLIIMGVIISFLIFYKAEKNALDPLIPLALFKNQIFTVQIVTALLLSGIQIGFQTYFPMWLQSVYKTSASVAGLAVTPSPIMWLVASFFVGGLVKKVAPKKIVVPLVAIQLLFYIPLIFARINFPQFMFYLIAGVTGVVLGIVITMNTLVSQRVTPEKYLGTASSMLTLGRTLGQTFATGIFGLIFNIAINEKISTNSTVSIKSINIYISNGGINFDGSTKQLNTIILSGMHAVFAAVLIAFIIVLSLNFFDKNKEIIQ